MVASRQLWVSCAPSNTPRTMFVLPTSMAKSMVLLGSAWFYLVLQGSVLRFRQVLRFHQVLGFRYVLGSARCLGSARFSVTDVLGSRGCWISRASSVQDSSPTYFARDNPLGAIADPHEECPAIVDTRCNTALHA